MKNLLPILLCSFLFGSCCSTGDACGPGNPYKLKFVGFTVAELDTIYVTTYLPGTGAISDSERIVTSNFVSSTDTSVTLSKERKWKLYIPSVNREFMVAGNTYKIQECKSCGRKSKGETMETYKVNETVYNENQPAIIYR